MASFIRRKIILTNKIRRRRRRRDSIWVEIANVKRKMISFINFLFNFLKRNIIKINTILALKRKLMQRRPIRELVARGILPGKENFMQKIIRDFILIARNYYVTVLGAFLL